MRDGERVCCHGHGEEWCDLCDNEIDQCFIDPEGHCDTHDVDVATDTSTWYAEPYAPTVLELRDLFGENGNFEDYWLGVPKLDNTRILEQDRWYSIEPFIRLLRLLELRQWTRGGVVDKKGNKISRVALERLGRRAPNAVEGGGIIGLDPAIHLVDAGLLSRGQMYRASAAYAG